MGTSAKVLYSEDYEIPVNVRITVQADRGMGEVRIVGRSLKRNLTYPMSGASIEYCSLVERYAITSSGNENIYAKRYLLTLESVDGMVILDLDMAFKRDDVVYAVRSGPYRNTSVVCY